MGNISARDFVKDGIWFRDTRGRFVLFRGVNFASRSKLPPYLPISPLQSKGITLQELKKELRIIEPEIKRLAELGFNIVRLLVMWKAIEPRPNPNLDQLLPEGENYLNLVKEIIDMLYSNGLFVIIDFHQDIAHEVYGGDGFPDWALAIDECHLKPIPLSNPFSNVKARGWAVGYYLNYLVRNTLESFWKNNLKNAEEGLEGYPVRTHLEKTVGQTVRFFKALNGGNGHPAILGFSPFNEPHPVGLGKQFFEENILKEFYSNVLAEISKFDHKAFIFIEPRLEWTVYPATDSGIELQFPFIRDPEQIHTWLPIDSEFKEQYKSQGIFSFHYYDPWTSSYALFNVADNMHNKQKEWPKIFIKLREAAISRGLVPFLTEFGGSHDWDELYTDIEPRDTYQTKQIRAYMDLQYQQVETYLLNSTYWNYDLYNTVDQKDNWNLENFSLLGPGRKPRHIDIAARPYPQYSSAEPHLLSFDLKSKYCVIVLKGLAVEAPTQIYIPYKVHYNQAFKVWSTSNHFEWHSENQVMRWWPDRNETINQIVVTPISDKIDTSILPQISRDLMNKTSFRQEFGS
ncbi:MAG TPA: cellulase family glycosylhydrolase [Nitrososphaeraceae archaeon]